MAGDVLLGRWLLLPLYVASFYVGTLVIALATYPLLKVWRAWLRPRDVRAWYLVEVGVLWVGTAGVLTLFSPWWLQWRWDDLLALQVAGILILLPSMGVGAWAMMKMGWARLLLAAALCPPAPGAQKDHIPQRLVVMGPYRYVRNPLYTMDVGIILATALLSSSWWLAILAVVYVFQLRMHLYFEERELQARFGETYTHYCQLVPRFIPRRTPADPAEVYGAPALPSTLIHSTAE